MRERESNPDPRIFTPNTIGRATVLVIGAAALGAAALGAVPTAAASPTAASAATAEPGVAAAPSAASPLPPKQEPNRAVPGANPEPEPVRRLQTRPDDAIRAAVEDRLVADGLIDPERVAIRVRDGVVELDGEIDRLLVKARAGALAEAVKGVRAVSNRLRVQPLRPVPDARIAERIANSLRLDPATAREDVQIQVDAGRVTLTGRVGSWPEKRSAGRVAQASEGVTELDNQLVVEYAESRSDAEIRADVAEQLRWDPRLAPAPIAVAVADAEVRLTGRVGSADQRRWAAAHAWVNGVDDVDISGLMIDPEVAQDSRADLVPYRIPTRNDAAIADALTNALRVDPRVNRDAVTAEVEDGWVTLNGIVASSAAAQSAEAVARRTVGVGGVTNRLRVEPVQRVDDDQLRQRVRAALDRNPITSGRQLAVRVDDGRVALYGNLDRERQVSEALKVAAAVAGVVSVNNEIELRPPRAPGAEAGPGPQ